MSPTLSSILFVLVFSFDQCRDVGIEHAVRELSAPFARRSMAETGVPLFRSYRKIYAFGSFAQPFDVDERSAHARACQEAGSNLVALSLCFTLTGFCFFLRIFVRELCSSPPPPPLADAKAGGSSAVAQSSSSSADAGAVEGTFWRCLPSFDIDFANCIGGPASSSVSIRVKRYANVDANSTTDNNYNKYNFASNWVQ
jgi:hypothetical protein